MIKSIVTNIAELKIPCIPVEKGENIKEIIQDLKDTLISKNGLGLSANQIGYNKKVAYCRVPFYNKDIKQIEIREFTLINPEIIKREKKYIVNGEVCLSFPGLKMITSRYAFIIVENYNEKGEVNTILAKDYEALTIQHEVDHLNGLTIFNRKYQAR